MENPVEKSVEKSVEKLVEINISLIFNQKENLSLLYIYWHKSQNLKKWPCGSIIGCFIIAPFQKNK